MQHRGRFERLSAIALMVGGVPTPSLYSGLVTAPTTLDVGRIGCMALCRATTTTATATHGARDQPGSAVPNGKSGIGDLGDRHFE